MKRTEVFTPNDLPTVTLVGEHLKEKTKILEQNLELGGSVIVISGPSKSGKTVFVESVIGRDNLIHVSGANITAAEELWRRIFTVIGTPIPSTALDSKISEVNSSASIEGGVPLVTKGTVSLGGKWTSTGSTTADVRPDYLALLVTELKGSGLVVFVDDFHYIAKEVQVQVAEVIKEAVRQGAQFILAAVPYHSDDVVIANADLRGRMLNLDFDYWDAPELSKIASKGFKELNMQVSDSIISTFAMEAAGSPQLMQSLCLNLCFEIDAKETTPEKLIVTGTIDLIDRICRRAAQTNDYRSVMRVMKEGPKVRGTDRKPYVLKDQTASDVYPIIVKALALPPPQLTLSYPDLLKRISDVCLREHPQGSSVTGACAHMSALANDAANAAIIEWDGDKDVLDIRDPYLLFALRWSESS